MKPAAKLRQLLPLAAAVIGVLLGGCIVQSVYPFYTAKDVVFEPALLGTWTEADDAAAETWVFEKFGDKSYRTVFTGRSETNRFETHLFQLKQQKYLDLCSVERPEGHLPVHYLFKVESIQPTFKVSAMAARWLEELLGKDSKTIRHIRVPAVAGSTNRSDVVLTADTKELQEFVLKHAKNTNAFSEPVEWKRRK